MRLRMIMASAAALLLASATVVPAAAQSASGLAFNAVPAVVAIAAQQTQAQPPQGGDVQIDVGIEDGSTWYANPVWIVIGLLAVVVIALVVGMAARSGNGNGSTIVK